MAIDELTTSSGEMEMKVVINALIKKMEIRVEQIADLAEKVEELTTAHTGRLVNVDQAIARLSTRFRAREADTGHFDEIFEDNREAIADLTEKVDKQQVRIETLEMPYTWCYICGSPLVDGKCPCGENTPARTNPRYPREET